MPPRQVTEDNNKFSFVSMRISIAGRTFTEINGMSYNDTINRSFVYGTSPYPLGRTRGTYAAGGMISILKEDHNALIKFLGQGWAAKEFDCICTYQELGQPLVTDQLYRSAFADGKDAWRYGPDPLYIEANLTVIAIVRDGIWPYGVPKPPT